LRASFSKTHWLAWAKVLHLKDSSGVLEAEFEKASDRFSLWIERYEALMTSQVPCNRGPLDLLSAIFPTRLMRQLAKDFSVPWGITTDNWIAVEAEAELPHRIRDKHPKSSLPKWISQQAPSAPILEVIQSDLRQPSFTALRRGFGKPEADELKEAERLLTEKLRPVQNDTPSVEEIAVPTIEEWTVSDLWHWWERQGKPITAYTLDGDTNWNLLFPGESGNADARRKRVKEVLLTPESDEGKRTWYRLLGLACLMSAGRRMTEVRSFWQSELEARQFWTRTSQATFGHATDALFSELISRPINNLAASGEHAYFWRRVFYDIRKIHQLVWENQFPATMLELVRSGHGANLVNFLHTGQLPGQPAWVGVFGQSAGSPLFFVVRELCRLGVITDPAVRPLAFFVSTPVRRASERIGWLKAEEARRVDFESLAAMSEKFHRKIAADRVFGERLLPYYDIPLLHYGLEG
jgi:hypothetical protein